MFSIEALATEFDIPSPELQAILYNANIVADSFGDDGDTPTYGWEALNYLAHTFPDRHSPEVFPKVETAVELMVTLPEVIFRCKHVV